MIASRLLPVVALVALAQGCASAAPKATLPGAALCAPEQLDACERRLAASLADGEVSRPLVAAYVAARGAREPADVWAKLYRDLDAADRGARSKAVVVAEGAAPEVKGVRVIVAQRLPSPSAIGADDLLLALASATGYQEVVRVRGGDVAELFPGDPLAPWMGGLRPVVRDARALAHLEADRDAEDAMRAAFDAASSFAYVEAARAASRLAAIVARRERDPVTLRHRYALELLGAAGLVLDAEDAAAAPSAKPANSSDDEVGPGPDATPYASYLHVLAAKDARKAWETWGAKVLEGIAEDRREAFASLFTRPHDCEGQRPPPMDGTRDLVFANKLANALEPDPAAPPRRGKLPLQDWLERYRTLVDRVERTRTGWSFLPALLQQRGETPGLSASGTALYRRVTALGLAHLAATASLEQAYPARYRAFSVLAVGMSPGTLADDELRPALVKLVEASVKDKLVAAEDAEALLYAIGAGVVAGISYPPTLQKAHFSALSAATTARLRGDFLKKTGWGVALLYAIDGAYRLATDQGSKPSASATQIARSLRGPDVAHPALASLATAAARYAALAAEHELDATAVGRDEASPERRAARAELRLALAGLGAPGEAPEGVLDDVTTLTDGVVATLSSALAPNASTKRAPRPGVCARKASAVVLDPALRRTLGRLGDVRRRILLHPRYRTGEGAWLRRVRLLVTVLSDAMDLVLESDAPMRAGIRKAPVFTIATADARRAVEQALSDLDQKALAQVVGGGYGLFREFVAAADPEQLLRTSGNDLERVAGGLFDLFRGDALGGAGPAMGVALLDALASMRIATSSRDDLLATLATYATAFYAKHEPDQGDLCLLGALVLSSVTKAGLPSSLLELAAKEKSRVAWILRFSEEVEHHRTPDPAVYADDLRRATDDACQAPDAEATLAVMGAIHDFAAGKRKEARDALDRVLERADERGLGVPRMVYRYDEKTATKVFQVTVDLSYGMGLLSGGNTFQLGLGFRSGGEPGGALTSSLAPVDVAKAGDEAARYYVATAALATVYHLLDGDAERAIATGRRVVVAASGGLKLGPRSLHTDKPASWSADARTALVLAAQLAADAGQPFLAGDLWTVVRQGFSDTLDDKEVSAMLDALPVGLAGLGELAPVAARAKRSLEILAAPLPCTKDKVELGGFEEVACSDYPLALSLRIADALKKLPRLRRGGATSPHCGAWKSLDAFLAGADRKAYDPDAFTRAVEDLRADGKIYDASVLLTRHKLPNHCSPGIVAAARTLGRSPILGPWVRSDLLSVAVNCAAAGGGPDVEEDLVQIDADTRKLADPTRNLRLLLSVAELATRTDHWEMLAKLVEQPDFLAHWMGIHPNAAATALLLDHAVAAIAGRAVALERTKASYQLLCEAFKSPDRSELCGLVEALRAPLSGPVAERQRLAKDAVRRLLGMLAGPPSSRRP